MMFQKKHSSLLKKWFIRYVLFAADSCFTDDLLFYTVIRFCEISANIQQNFADICSRHFSKIYFRIRHI